MQLCECYVVRLNKTNPYVHHVIEINPDLYDIAATLDAERANGTTRGPLHGIPIVSKDNIATDDGFNSKSLIPLFGWKDSMINCGLEADKEAGPIAQRMKDWIEGIQYGDETHPWSFKI